jgi:hypothetical protein
MRPALAASVAILLAAPAGGPQAGKPWIEMDYGPFLSATVQLRPGLVARKGIAVRLDPGPGGVSQGAAFAIFDTDTLRVAGAWTGRGFIDWKGIAFDGSHQTHPSVAGRVLYANPDGPGWAHPQDGTFADPRPKGSDARPYGPLPRAWARWTGLTLDGDRVALAYRLGPVDVMEHHALEGSLISRTIRLGPRAMDLVLQVAHREGARASIKDGTAFFDGVPAVAFARTGGPDGTAWQSAGDGHLRLRIPAGREPAVVKILAAAPATEGEFLAAAARSPAPADPAPRARGGAPRWPETVAVPAEPPLPADGPWAVESLPLPVRNPWRSWMRPGGFDFFKGGDRAAVCTWSGDVWTVDGLGGRELRWRRFAAGLFQPLGLRIVDGAVYVSGRDQITRLHDLDGDGEADFYENFNNDHQVTEHFHEFAMDLQTDPEGRFYYAKAARHALDSVVPQHGTLVRVSPDGARSEILCNGFRAPNGVGIGPGGELATSDQEGHWMPANRINLVRPGGFYGNMFSYHAGERPKGYEPPLLWLPKKVDRSPAQQLWVAGDRWGLPAGGLLSLSYGTGQIFHVMVDRQGDRAQGTAVPLPLAFPTGIMRGRFHPGDGQLYVCGLYGWSSDRTAPGGFFRVRSTGKPLRLPLACRAVRDGLEISFSDPLDRAAAEDPESYSVRRWNYRWTERYGSDPYSVAEPDRKGEDSVEVAGASLSGDGRTVRLRLGDFRAVMQMEIRFALRGADGAPVRRTLHGSVHWIPE